MYVLYYLNSNFQIGTIEVETLNMPILIPENLIFINLRKGINFIKEPDQCCDFTHLERLIMASEFTDMETIKEGDFRRANTYLNVLCQVDLDKPYYDPNSPIPYIVYYQSTFGDEQVGKIHFNMPMPAQGLYEFEESYDKGVTWWRMTYFCPQGEQIEIPENPGSFVDTFLLGSSEIPVCNNSMYMRVYQDNQLVRIKKDGVVVSQESYYIKYK